MTDCNRSNHERDLNDLIDTPRNMFKQEIRDLLPKSRQSVCSVALSLRYSKSLSKLFQPIDANRDAMIAHRGATWGTPLCEYRQLTNAFRGTNNRQLLCKNLRATNIRRSSIKVVNPREGIVANADYFSLL
jgi:hypothetical protein